MPGFIGSLGKLSINKKSSNRDELVIDTIKYNQFNIERRTISKFLDDKLFIELDNVIILIEGVILNKAELFQKYSAKNILDLFNILFKKSPEKWMKFLKGSFSGLIFDKKTEYLTLFTDQIGDKQIYFYIHEKNIIFGTDFWELVDIIKLNNLPLSPDKQGEYSLLTYGFQLDNNTLIEEIKKVTAGTSIVCQKGNILKKQYHRFTNAPNHTLTTVNIIEKIEVLFTKAVQRQLDKNEEYSYENFAPLSAGLDSRMISVFTNKLLNKPIYNITYSQNGFYDDTVPKKISEDFGNHFIYKSLDNGLSLFQFDEITNITGSAVLNYGPAQVWDFIKNINPSDIGLIHTGMLGDVVVGTFFLNKKWKETFELGDGAYSKTLLKGLKKWYRFDQEFKYENQEIFNFYNRGFNGANMGSPLVFQQITESYSPFYDLDFLEFCLTIPPELKWDNKLYYKWVNTKNKLALNYPHNGRKINTKLLIPYKDKNYTFQEFLKLGKQKIKRKLGLLKKSPLSMNPLEYWYEKNSNLRTYMDSYFEENIKFIKNQELKLDCINLYKSGCGSEKDQVLSLLAFHKRLNSSI